MGDIIPGPWEDSRTMVDAVLEQAGAPVSQEIVRAIEAELARGVVPPEDVAQEKRALLTEGTSTENLVVFLTRSVAGEWSHRAAYFQAILDVLRERRVLPDSQNQKSNFTP